MSHLSKTSWTIAYTMTKLGIPSNPNIDILRTNTITFITKVVHHKTSPLPCTTHPHLHFISRH